MRKKITHNITITYYINCSRYSSQLMLSENIWRISTQEKPFSPLTTIFWSLRMEMYLLRWWMRRTHWLQWNMSPARRADGDIMTWRMTLRVLWWSSTRRPGNQWSYTRWLYKVQTLKLSSIACKRTITAAQKSNRGQFCMRILKLPLLYEFEKELTKIFKVKDKAQKSEKIPLLFCVAVLYSGRD